MNQIAEYMRLYAERNQLNALEGGIETKVPGVGFYRSGQSSPKVPLIYQSGIILMGQGHKHIYLGKHKMSYGPGDYVVIGMPLPLECEAITEAGKPIFGITIDASPSLLHKVVKHVDLSDHVPKLNSGLGMNCTPLCDPLQDAFLRLMKVLQDDAEAVFLGPCIVQEIVYRILQGPTGSPLYERANANGNYAKIAKILDLVHTRFDVPLTVEELAEKAHMSVPAFHRVFKQVTAESPLQYMKKVRLSKARELIVSQGVKAAEAARRVGYNSASQFSREYKRHFNYSPKDSQLRAS